MLLDIPFTADWEVLRQGRQLQINEILRTTNKKRKSFDYQPGQRVLVKKPGILQKLAEKWTGPCAIVKVHVNGNVTLRMTQRITMRLNIRRIKPYKEPNTS